MSNRKEYLLCAAAVSAVLLFCTTADAGPFGLFGRNKVNKNVEYTPNGSSCVRGPDGKCLTHNPSGTTTGSGDPEMDAYLGHLGYTRAKSKDVVITIEDEIVEDESDVSASVAEAEAAVTAAKKALRDKQEALRLAEQREHLQNKKGLIALEALADTRAAEQDQESDELWERIEELRAKVELSSCCSTSDGSGNAVPTPAPPQE